MLGSIHDGRLEIEELHRFSNRPLQTASSLTWDIAGLFAGLKEGLVKAARRGVPLTSIGCDSWGLDYLLLDQSGAVIPPVFHYRDGRTAAGWQKVFSRSTREEIFGETGVQFMAINTLYQLASESPERLDQATALLNIGDAFNFFLSGAVQAERSLASTTQLYNPLTRDWSETLIRTFQFPRRLFPGLVSPGARIGPLRSDLAAQTGLRSVEVVASCSHDTAAAVAGVPAMAGSWAYISSGTWSLLGLERSTPLLTPRCRELNFTNEVGFGDTIRLLKNLVGLWVVQECRRSWADAGQAYDYPELTRMAEQAGPAESIINLADPRFLSAGGMPEKIQVFCVESGQAPPREPGRIIRCVLESLALLYLQTLRELEEVTGERIGRVHIVGGGSKNRLLNQLTANALQIPVLAGPVEATAAGNILVQAMAAGQIESLAAGRQIIERSTQLEVFEPEQTCGPEAGVEKFMIIEEKKESEEG